MLCRTGMVQELWDLNEILSWQTVSGSLSFLHNSSAIILNLKVWVDFKMLYFSRRGLAAGDMIDQLRVLASQRWTRVHILALRKAESHSLRQAETGGWIMVVGCQLHGVCVGDHKVQIQ